MCAAELNNHNILPDALNIFMKTRNTRRKAKAMAGDLLVLTALCANDRAATTDQFMHYPEESGLF